MTLQLCNGVKTTPRFEGRHCKHQGHEPFLDADGICIHEPQAALAWLESSVANSRCSKDWAQNIESCRMAVLQASSCWQVVVHSLSLTSSRQIGGCQVFVLYVVKMIRKCWGCLWCLFAIAYSLINVADSMS